MYHQSSTTIMRKDRRHGLCMAGCLVLLLALLISSWTGQTSAAPLQADTNTCGLTVEIIAAPFAAVDSNKPGLEGPMVAILGARIINTGNTTIANVTVHLGDGVTPGVFPTSGGGRLAMLQSNDSSHYLNDLVPGKQVTSYWPITYPATYDVSYSYVVWATTVSGCTVSSASQITTQSEIGAGSNNILPTGSLLQVYPSLVKPGSTITVQITGFSLGSIGSGPKPSNPADAWLQPIGNLDFDPTCLRLARTEVRLGSISATPYVDRLYFKNIGNYSAKLSDYVKYTFVALRSCTTTVRPYQQAASGTQEKYSADFSASTSRITSTPFEYAVHLAPGTSTLALTFPALLDVTVYAEYDGFVDKVYTGGGLWFTFSRSQSAETTMTTSVCRPLGDLNLQDLLLAGCLTADSSNVSEADEVGLGRTLNPNGRPVDVSAYTAVRFWARGNGAPVRIVLESAVIQDGDFYQTVFTPATEWQQYVIPLREFRQRGFGTPVPYTGRDVKALVWLNADSGNGVFHLAVDQASFTNSSLMQAINLPGNVTAAGPQEISAVVPNAVIVSAMTLHYSLDDGATYGRLPMIITDQSAAGTTYTGRIPTQALGTDVRFYMLLTDPLGYASRSPIDAPAGFYRYGVDDRNSLLIDDFAGGRLQNRLGGEAGIFNNPDAGGRIMAYCQNDRLRLEYAVTGSGQYAGYFTRLNGLDMRSYTSLNLLVRGESGQEHLLVGVKDSRGAEVKLSVGDLLPGGLSKEWRWVQLPLRSLATRLDLSSVADVSFSFTNGYPGQTGSLQLGEIRLTNLATPLVVDTFDDGNDQRNGVGLDHWTSAPNGTIQATYTTGDAYQATGSALKLDYTVAANSYALWTTSLGGLRAPADASLWFWVRSDQLSLLPNVYLADNSTRVRVPLADYVTPNNTW